MKKTILVFSLIFVFALTSLAMAGLMDKVKNAAKAVKGGEKHELKLSDIDKDLASYEGGEFDVVTANKDKYVYTTYDDATWDAIATSAAKSCLCTDFAEKVVNSPNAKDADFQAALKVFEPMTTEAAKLMSSVTSFIGQVKADPTKALMLKDAMKVKDQVKTMTDKAPALLKGLKDKAAAEKAKAEEK